MARKLGPGAPGDGTASQPAAHDAVVIEDGLAVTRQPHVALQPGGPEAHSEPKALKRVLGGVGPGSPVTEADRRVAQGGQPGGHDGPLCQPRSSGKVTS